MSAIQYSARSDSDSGFKDSAETTGEIDPWQVEVDIGPKVKVDKEIISIVNRNVNLFDLIRSMKINLEEVYSPSGWDFKGCCPFPDHQDNSPSFGVHPKENRFYCFGCQKGGGSVQFLSFIKRLTLQGAVEHLLDNNGYYLYDAIDNFQNSFDEEILNELLRFSERVNDFMVKNNFYNYGPGLKFIENVTWSLDLYLQKNLMTKTVSFENLKARIKLLEEKINKYAKQNNYNW